MTASHNQTDEAVNVTDETELKPCPIARYIAENIASEISDRRGIGHELQQIADYDRSVMIDEWAFMIMEYANTRPAIEADLRAQLATAREALEQENALLKSEIAYLLRLFPSGIHDKKYTDDNKVMSFLLHTKEAENIREISERQALAAIDQGAK